MPDKSVEFPQVNLANPIIGSIPIVASHKPIRPDIMVCITLPLSRQVKTERPRKEIANSSEGPNFKATLTSCGVSKNIARAANIPPIAEDTSEIPKALPDSPPIAIG
ncbi:hypothetical protein SDC9_144271 [bioreactor metagenome]|uniref:Uncharacterized protein n=1 Tax=bioreactor metagenome TaxID=1076179 RepID=A0A645E778_9ZZZZ